MTIYLTPFLKKFCVTSDYIESNVSVTHTVLHFTDFEPLMFVVNETCSAIKLYWGFYLFDWCSVKMLHLTCAVKTQSKHSTVNWFIWLVINSYEFYGIIFLPEAKLVSLSKVNFLINISIMLVKYILCMQFWCTKCMQMYLNMAEPHGMSCFISLWHSAGFLHHTHCGPIDESALHMLGLWF